MAGPSRRLSAADRPRPRLVCWTPTTKCRTSASRRCPRRTPTTSTNLVQEGEGWSEEVSDGLLLRTVPDPCDAPDLIRA
eukprot:6795727-Alexandrium_andersonii.AAC.1